MLKTDFYLEKVMKKQKNFKNMFYNIKKKLQGK